MPEMIPVGNTGIQPDTLGSISKMIGLRSSMIGLQQQQQNLQTGQYAQQTAQATAQGAQRTQAEQQAVSNLVKNAYTSGRYKDAQGNFDNQKFANDVMQVAPTTGGEIANSAVTRAGEIYQNQKTLFGLNADRRTQIGNALGTLAAQVDPTTGQPTATHSDLINTVEALRQQNPNDPDYSRMLTSMATAVPPDAKGPQLQQILRNAALMTNAPSAAQTTPAISTMQGPGGLQAVNTNPQAVGGIGQRGAPLPQGIAPQIITNPTTGGPTVVGPGPGGGSTPIKGPGMQPTVDLPTVKVNVEQARKAGDAVGNNRKINQTILNLLPQTTTGKGTDFFHQIAATAGTNTGSSYQELGAFLDRQAASAASSMGLPNTNAGLETAQNLTGNTQLANKTIEDKTKYADALNTAAGVYRAGLEKRLGTTTNPNAPPNYNGEPAYRAAWAANFDPDIFAYENAVKRPGGPDKEELAKIEKDNGTKGMAQLLQKRKTLMSLVNGQ